MKKLVMIIVVVMVCAFLLAACTPAATETTESASAEQTQVAEASAETAQTTEAAASAEASSGDKPLIGFNNFLKGNYSVDILEKTIQATCEALGCDFMAVNDEAKVENSVTNVDNMIAAGVDGIVFLGVADTLFPVIAQKCEAAGVPFVITDHLPSDDVVAQLETFTQYIGGACVKDINTGKKIGEYAASLGLKKAIIVTADKTDTTHAARTSGFTETFEAAGGQVLDIGYGTPTVAESMTRANDLLTAHPDVDCIYATNGDVVSGTMEALAKHTDVNAKVFGTDLDPDVLDGLKGGQVAAANGAHWINGDFSTALLINHLRGNDIKDADGTAPMLIVPTMTLPSNMVDLYNQFWIEQQPFAPEEMQAMVSSGITATDLQGLLDNYTIETRLQAKVDAGVLTQDELDAAFAK